MTEQRDIVREGKEYRQRIMDKMSEEHSTSYTYDENKKEPECDKAIEDVREKNQRKMDEAAA